MGIYPYVHDPTPDHMCAPVLDPLATLASGSTSTGVLPTSQIVKSVLPHSPPPGIVSIDHLADHVRWISVPQETQSGTA